jgi:hypothetical protein
VLFCPQVSEYVLLFLLLLSSSFIALLSDSMQGVISIFLYLLRLLCDLKCGLLWRKFHGPLRRMYIVLLHDGILCRHLWGPFDLWCHLILEFLLLIFLFG